jgi:hypothetical protein
MVLVPDHSLDGALPIRAFAGEAHADSESPLVQGDRSIGKRASLRSRIEAECVCFKIGVAREVTSLMC